MCFSNNERFGITVTVGERDTLTPRRSELDRVVIELRQRQLLRVRISNAI